MSTTFHSFMDIFEINSTEEQTDVLLNKIVIPKIQRDYAQGRNDPDVTRIRNRFLDSLYSAVMQKPITLDFVYGDVDENAVMTPLDGQQRLTTLFLLHWYAACKCSVPMDECKFLQNFGYETRYSARDFCKELVTNLSPSFTRSLSDTHTLSDEIIDQAWFPLSWQKDPTISSMLTMLDDIDKRFKNVDDLWDRLKNGAIRFYFLPIQDMGLTDELYIKMNSRGKPLTQFEHFKAELERTIRAINEETAKRIMRKIDREWTDMLWRYRDAGNGKADDTVVDDEFLKYFRFICDVIYYENNESPQNKNEDEFDLLQKFFSGDPVKGKANIELLESYFDCWDTIDGYENPTEFLKTCMSYTHETGKIVIDTRNKIDIFEDCLHTYADRSGRTRLFPLNRIVLLYAIVCYLRNRASITEGDFIRRLRVINNLIQNSEDEISERENRNRMPAILAQTDAIMRTGQISDDIQNSFNVNQIAEEKEKKEFLEQNPEQAEYVFKLEDHPLLKGQISVVGLDHIAYADRFYSLFNCNRDLIDCALMSIGDYGQKEGGSNPRYQYASSSSRMQIAWEKLFHKSGNVGFDKTRDTLIALLGKTEVFTDDVLQKTVDEYIHLCEKEKRFPWRYYYVKYSAFRPGSYGKYVNSDKNNTPYMFLVLQTRSQLSTNSYMPYLKEVDDDHLDKNSMGQRLYYGDRYIICENDRYLICKKDTEEIIESIQIDQDNNADTVDRIQMLRQIVERLQIKA